MLVYVIVDDHGEVPAVFEFIDAAVNFVNKSGKFYRIIKIYTQ